MTREPQYRTMFAHHDHDKLGVMAADTWLRDPKRLGFVLARYKFVAKMLGGKSRVLEVGCGDGWASRVVEQEVGRLTCVDFDPAFIVDAVQRSGGKDGRGIGFHVADMTVHGDGPCSGPNWMFDAAYCLDVIEHISRAKEEIFLDNICTSLTPDGVLIVGTPSLESQVHASEQSRDGHVNCKTYFQLEWFMRHRFENVFMFGMNDEVLHTGFGPMCHYLLAVGCGQRSAQDIGRIY